MAKKRAPNPLIQIASRHQVYLEGLKASEAKKILPFLRKVSREVSGKLGGAELTEFNRARLEKMLKVVERDINVLTGKRRKELTGDLKDIAEYESGFEVRSLEQMVNVELALPSVAQLVGAITLNPMAATSPAGGTLLDTFLDGFDKRTVDNITGAIRMGYFQGETNSQILRRIRGTRENGFRDGIISRIGTDAEGILRTSIQHVSNQARQETWNNNEDIAEGVEIVATFDDVTSAICRSMDGQVFPINKGPRPPFHPYCRTTTALKLKEEFAELNEGATRRAKDDDGVGHVHADQTYYDWLKTQPAGFQNSVLGPQRGKLLRDGGLSAERFAELQLGKTFVPLTLEQMRRLEPLAFDKAGL